MSDAPSRIPPSLPPPPPRSGCLTAIMVLVGLVLLLPGLCAVLFGVDSVYESHPDPTVIALVLFGLMVGAFGVWLIWSAIRGRRP